MPVQPSSSAGTEETKETERKFAFYYHYWSRNRKARKRQHVISGILGRQFHFPADSLPVRGRALWSSSMELATELLRDLKRETTVGVIMALDVCDK